MKKKIKDLTLEDDVEKSICEKYKNCIDCPLRSKSSYCYYDYLLAKQQNKYQIDLEREVEVDE